MAIEPTVEQLVTEDQRGFLGGRSMIANLVDVDEAMHLYAASSSDAVALFYDFAAAFPSIAHLLLFLYFAAMDWPLWIRNIILGLYFRNACIISLGGALHPGFAITRGIRQGCPLSPLLFAVVSELLLRKLRRTFWNTVNRAWADDLAMIMHGGFRRLQALAALFYEFATISGLSLNIKKQCWYHFSRMTWLNCRSYYLGRHHLGSGSPFVRRLSTWALW